MRMTTELTETATAVQSLPSLLYAAIRCCCCSFFRHRQLGCSFSCLSLPALPLRHGAGLAAHPVTDGRQCRVSGQVGSSPSSCKREQPRTAAQHSAGGGQPRDFLLASLPPISTSSCMLPRYLPTYPGTYLARRPSRCCKTSLSHTWRHKSIVSLVFKYKNLERHPKSESIYTRARGGG